MARASLSGFPEWLPDQRIVEQQVLATIARIFEVHGFASVRTRAVEPLSQLLRKGETSKEVYVLGRLQEEGDVPEDADRLGLHFDLTVPFARFVMENAGHLAFPFKRYQIQPVWRGERPQEGRFREFWQADIDVVGDGELPFHFEVEVALVATEALTALREFGLEEFRVLVNNRKVAEGFYRSHGLTDPDEVLRIIDKLAKIGPEKVAEQLADQVGADAEQIQACLAMARLRGGVEVIAQVRALAGERDDVALELLEAGLIELEALLTAGVERAPGLIEADLSVARGLDYYTGSVYETVLVGQEHLGSICSGGRYDSLATDGKRTFPGVGISIGVSRVLARLFATEAVKATRSVPTAVLVAVNDEAGRVDSDLVAAALRSRGIPTDVAPSAAKFGKQIRYADRRGIPFVWFVGAAQEGIPTHEVKDIRSGEQVAADPATWRPPIEDEWPRAVVG